MDSPMMKLLRKYAEKIATAPAPTPDPDEPAEQEEA